jgi:branched-chain amino acid transport system substrate-binding protein
MRAKGALLGLALAALMGGTAAAQETLKIGAIGSLSGGGTAWGLAIKRAVELAVDQTNEAGGVKVGDKTLKVEYVMYDDQYSGQGGKVAAERLVNNDNVKFIIGPIGSPPVLSAIGVTTPAKVLVLSNGYAPQILKNEAKSPYNFRISMTSTEFTPGIVKWVRQNLPNVKKIGVLAPNDAVGQSVAPIAVEEYKKQGLETWFEQFERGTKEFTPLIIRMMAAKVDLLELDGNTPGDSGLLIKQARQAGFRGTIIQTGGPAVPEIMEIAGSFAEGFLSYEMADFTTPSGQKLEAAYSKKYGKGIINSQFPAFYNATLMMIEAIRRAGTTTDVDKVRDTLERMDGYDAGVYGPLKWSGLEAYGVRHQIALPFFLVEVKGGKVVPKATID